MRFLTFFWLLAGLGLGLPTWAQGPQDFYANIVKIAGNKFDGTKPQYGFITGTGAASEIYFVLFSKDKQFLEHHKKLNILYRSKKENKLTEATQVPTVPYATVGDYFVAVFRATGTFAIHKRFYQGLHPAELEGYRLIWDTAEDDNDFKPHYGSRERDEINQQEGQRAQHAGRLPVKFEVVSDTRGALARAGMPLLSGQGTLVGVVAENQDAAYRKFEVLPILAIRHRLENLGKALGSSECAYFNLLELNHTETTCDSLARMEALHRKTQAEQAAYWASLKKEEKQVIRRDKNYAFAVSAGGGGYLGNASFSTGTDNSSQLGWGYAYGLNLHLRPDQGVLRLTLKPRSTVYNFNPPSNYSYPSTSSGFALKSMRVTALELPVLLEVVTSRDATANSYFGLGYAYGWQRKAEFAYTTTGQPERTETLLGNPQPTHKFIAELGAESAQFRLSINYAYQFSQFLRRDYQFILNGETITPLQSTGKNYWHIGLELSYRLWGRWQNGRLTKTIVPPSSIQP